MSAAQQSLALVVNGVAARLSVRILRIWIGVRETEDLMGATIRLRMLWMLKTRRTQRQSCDGTNNQ
jgi:hypothetical protein